MSGIGDSGLSGMVANEKAMRNGANPPSYLSLERYQKRQRNGGGSQAKSFSVLSYLQSTGIGNMVSFRRRS